MITSGLKEYDVREIPTDESGIETIRFGDNYEDNLAVACRVTNYPEREYVAIQNEGYSRVVLNSADQAQRLIVALQLSIELGWLK